MHWGLKPIMIFHAQQRFSTLLSSSISFCLAASHLLESQLATFWLTKIIHIRNHLISFNTIFAFILLGFARACSMNKECIDKAAPLYCCICPLSKCQSVTWVGSLLTDDPTLVQCQCPHHHQFYRTSVTLRQCVTDGTRGGGLVASSQWLATH